MPTMSEIPFFRTQMGHHFFEGLLPELLAQLKALNVNLGRIAKALEQAKTSPAQE